VDQDSVLLLRPWVRGGDVNGSLRTGREAGAGAGATSVGACILSGIRDSRSRGARSLRRVCNISDGEGVGRGFGLGALRRGVDWFRGLLMEL
jgi:hypothetical protein